jgi:hypothetical protein
MTETKLVDAYQQQLDEIEICCDKTRQKRSNKKEIQLDSLHNLKHPLLT